VLQTPPACTEVVVDIAWLGWVVRVGLAGMAWVQVEDMASLILVKRTEGAAWARWVEFVVVCVCVCVCARACACVLSVYLCLHASVRACALSILTNE